jgi:hypothetical protein
MYKIKIGISTVFLSLERLSVTIKIEGKTKGKKYQLLSRLSGLYSPVDVGRKMIIKLNIINQLLNKTLFLTFKL